MPQIVITPDFGGLTRIEPAARVVRTIAETRGRVDQQIQSWTASVIDRWDEEQMRARQALANMIIL